MRGRSIAALAAAVLAAAGPALAQNSPEPGELGPQQANPSGPADAAPERFAVHGQVTYILQAHPAFRSPYAGPQSLTGKADTGRTVDATLYLGASPWDGAEVWVNPESYQGFAPGDTLGVAGYVNGDGAKVGKQHLYTRIARLFMRQTVDLGGEPEAVAPDLNQLGGSHSGDRLVVTAGKYSATDVFDTNKYAHDARHDFLNWSAIAAGSFDYAADAWGYTYGAAAEWYRGAWTVRAGLFDLSIVPNNKTLTPDLTQVQAVGEVERRFTMGGRPGAARVTGFVTRGRMGRYADAIALAAATGLAPDTGLVRRYRSRPGVDLNLEQEVAEGLGLFGRLGWADGRYEAYEYTDIDRTVEIGASLQGARWGRKEDSAGLALIANDVSSEAKRYFGAGGLGILVGDGRLPHPGPEEILEAYYSLGLLAFANLSLDYQLIAHPAYNRDRGPVNMLGLRVHLQR